MKSNLKIMNVKASASIVFDLEQRNADAFFSQTHNK